MTQDTDAADRTATDHHAPDVAGAVPSDGVFDDRDAREEALGDAYEGVVASLLDAAADDVEAALPEVEEFLSFMSTSTDYSARNRLLLWAQARARGWDEADDRECPPRMVGGYGFWQANDRYPERGSKALYVWAPIFDDVCPECGRGANARVDHREECGTDPDRADDPESAWHNTVVAYRPQDVYALCQTDGEAVPDIETAAGPGDAGDPGRLADALAAAGREEFGIDVTVVPGEEWESAIHGSDRGVFYPDREEVCVNGGLAPADRARVLAHELAHGVRHTVDSLPDPDPDRPRREVVVDGAAYVVGRAYGLDVQGAARYVARWCADVDGTDVDREGYGDGDDDRDPRVAAFRDKTHDIARVAHRLMSAADDHLPPELQVDPDPDALDGADDGGDGTREATPDAAD